MAGHPYRDLEHETRGPLTAREKTLAALRGLLKFEPLLEQHRFGLDIQNGLPLAERMKHARKIAASDSSENIAALIRAETSPDVKKILTEGFLNAFQRKYEDLHSSGCNSESGMHAIECFRQRDRFLESSLQALESLFSEGHIDIGSLRSMVSFMEVRRR
jgi:hypothetical protein